VDGTRGIGTPVRETAVSKTEKKVSMWEVRGAADGGGQKLLRALRQGNTPYTPDNSPYNTSQYSL
jgi:hypothetical protein